MEATKNARTVLSRFQSTILQKTVVVRQWAGRQPSSTSGVMAVLGLSFVFGVSLVSFSEERQIAETNIASFPGLPSSVGLIEGADAEKRMARAEIDYAISTLNLKLDRLLVSHATDSESIRLAACSGDLEPAARLTCIADAMDSSVARAPQFVPPVYGLITSEFGERKSPFGRKRTFHEGLDIAAPKNAVFVAAADGVVTSMEKKSGYGWLMTLEHEGGYETRYAHVGGGFVSVGQYVRRGQPIGVINNSGKTTGPHLHFEVFHNGILIDPRPLIDLPTTAEVTAQTKKKKS